jgi:hypothetical protein
MTFPQNLSEMISRKKQPKPHRRWNQNAFSASPSTRAELPNAEVISGIHTALGSSCGDHSHSRYSSSVTQTQIASVDVSIAERRPQHRPLCRYFQAGCCTRGARCKHAHGPCAPISADYEALITPTLIPCRYFLAGFCARGDDCVFQHFLMPMGTHKDVRIGRLNTIFMHSNSKLFLSPIRPRMSSLQCMNGSDQRSRQQSAPSEPKRGMTQR